MNVSNPLRAIPRRTYSLFYRLRKYLPAQRCHTFDSSSQDDQPRISRIFVVNLDRQPDRWTAVHRELSRVIGSDGRPLTDCAVRHPGRDAQTYLYNGGVCAAIDPVYTLADQLFVEPQPETLPAAFDLDRGIRMSQAELAVAGSHIDVWRRFTESDAEYALVLEDDVLLTRDFGQLVDQAWAEMTHSDCGIPSFDIFYLSYKEVRHGAPKSQLSQTVFRPERGLWYLSGYVLSRKGARRLLELLPCRGPIDLWVNHKFRDLDVRCLRRSVISQRLDLQSNNSYSILPALSRIGVIVSGERALYSARPTEIPVFAFSTSDTTLPSLAMALSMLGYRCCSDLDNLPYNEFKKLITGRRRQVFDAYVNIQSLEPRIADLRHRYRHAKFILIDSGKETTRARKVAMLDALSGASVLVLHSEAGPCWHRLCEFLLLPPPHAPYPTLPKTSQRKLQHSSLKRSSHQFSKRLRADRSPWIIPPRGDWFGIDSRPADTSLALTAYRKRFSDDFAKIHKHRWQLRDDTFPGNLGLFREHNVACHIAGGLSLNVRKERLGVRDLSAAALTSEERFLYGRFEATLQATATSGVVTGFFLHRDSPRQEIDIEITGNRPNRILINVYYNPGVEGAKYDYGYRGTPVSIPLGFDAAEGSHRYTIEWSPHCIRWLVDGREIYRRVQWDPTPIPHLPMQLHVNTWPTRSRQLAGRITDHLLPASSIVTNVSAEVLI